MTLHFADVFEAIADTIPEQPALLHGTVRRSWQAFDDRAARLAYDLAAAGLTPGAKVGLYLYNGPEYLEAQYAGFKLRATPVNVNYRYLDDELWYLLDNSDAEALVFHRTLADRVARVQDRLPNVKRWIAVDDGPAPDGAEVAGAVPYEDVIRASDPMPRIQRAEDDLYMLYTGGTTGMPKGVMYAMGGMTAGFLAGAYGASPLGVPTTVDEVAERVATMAEQGQLGVAVPACPLMHGTGMWLGAFYQQLAGAAVCTLASRNFDADELFATVEREGVTWIAIVGDAFARPMLRALDAAVASGRAYDTSSLRTIISSGVMFTSESKQALIEHVPQLAIIDAIGSTEGGMGLNVTMKGVSVETARFSQMPTTKVFKDDFSGEVVPGSGEAGLVAAGGNVPLGYYKDAEKSARTFKVIDGVRYSFPGDWALVEADGSITLLGRGSQCINTGGEKVFPEEVEEAVKRVAGVEDCLVVGVADERFGEAVTAVVATEPGTALGEAEVIASVKQQLAHYKAPKRVVFVTEVPRAPNGKADYRTAKSVAEAHSS